ncbi:ABC transporter permease subunit [Nemorincola caseinilytica]|uniref:ABC transporter permease subunit n=1 Tax=Nemorincola caseinilytica TaxID=2054315 RepID=A0ABP8NM24_9BACT
MIRLLQLELYKIFRRPRTYISFGVVTATAIIFQLAMGSGGKEFFEFGMQDISEQFNVQGNIINGYLVAYLILQSLLIQIPLLVALVAGDTLAGEANIGTLRLVLTRPITRTQLVLIKFAASTIYTILLITWLAVIALFLSLAIFGEGDMINLKSDAFVMILKDDVIWRYICAFGFAILAMTTIAALSMFLSAFADNGIGPIIATMGIVVVLTILSSLELPMFNAINPYLFTAHMVGWKGFFDADVPYAAIRHSAFILLLYTGGFLGGTLYYFNRKDINS